MHGKRLYVAIHARDDMAHIVLALLIGVNGCTRIMSRTVRLRYEKSFAADA